MRATSVLHAIERLVCLVTYTAYIVLGLAMLIFAVLCECPFCARALHADGDIGISYRVVPTARQTTLKWAQSMHTSALASVSVVFAS